MVKSIQSLHISSARARVLAITSLVIAGGSAAFADRADDLRALNQQVLALIKSSSLSDAEALAQRALPLCEEAGDSRVFCKGQFLELLSDIAFGQKQYDRALDYIKQSLIVREEGLGKQHFVVAQSDLRLARILIAQNRQGDAEPSAKAAVDILQAAAPESHDLTTAMRYLTIAYMYTNQYDKMLQIAERQLSLLQRRSQADSMTITVSKYYVVIALNHTDQNVRAQELAHEIVSAVAAFPPGNFEKWNFATQLVQIGTKLHLSKDLERAETALRDYMRFGDSDGTPPIPEWISKTAVSAHSHLGQVLSERGQREEAIEQHQYALQLEKKLFPKNDAELAIIIDNLAQLYLDRGDYNETIDFATQSIALLDRSNLQNRSLGIALLTLGRAYKAVGSYHEADSALHRSMAILDLALPEADEQRANVRNEIGDLQNGTHKLKDSVATYQEVLSMQKRFGYANSAYESGALTGLALTFRDMGRYEEAEHMLRESIKIEENVKDTRPSKLASRLIALATVLRREKRFNETESIVQQALALNPPPADQATAFTTLGLIYSATDRRDEAKKSFEKAIQIRELAQTTGIDRQLLDAHSGLATVESASGQYARAEATARANLALARNSTSSSTLLIAQHRLFLADTLRQNGKIKEARDLVNQSSAIYEKELEPNNPSLRVANRISAAIEIQDGKAPEAEARLQRVIEFDEAHADTPATEISNDLSDLAVAFRLEGKPQEATAALHRALNKIISIPIFEHGDDMVLNSREVLANALWNQGENETAERIFRETLAEIEKGPIPSSVEAAKASRALAAFLSNTGKPEEAIGLYMRARRIDGRIFGSDSREVAIDRARLGEALRIAGHWNDANEELSESRRALERIDDPMLKANIYTQLAAVALERRSTAEGVLHAEHSVHILEDAFGPDSPALIPSLSRLGRSYLLAKRTDDAEHVMERIDRLGGGNISESSAVFFDTALMRAQLLTNQQNYQAAQSLLEKAAAFADRTGATSMTGIIAYNLAQLNLLARRYEAAISQFQIASGQFQKQFGSQALITAYGLLGLAAAYEGTGDKRKAAETRMVAIKILRSLSISSFVPPRWL